MLRVAADAAPIAGRRTGVGTAVAGMLSALGERDDLDLVAFGLTGRGWDRVKALLPRGWRQARGPMPAVPLMAVWGRVDFPPAEAWTGPVDVVHGMNFVVPPTRSAGRVVTVYDMTAVHYPDLCTKTALRYPALISRAVSKGAWVHTNTQFVAGEIIDHFKVAPDRVRVVPLGVEPPSAGPPSAAPGPPSAAPGPPSAAPGPRYVLALGTVEPRKDYPGLVRAFDSLAGSHPDLELHIAGPPGWSEEALEEAIESSAYKSLIKRTGWTADRSALLSGASVLAYPSLYEGFGLPPLEAMSLGVPVVATAAGGVPEVVGDAAMLVPVGDEEALAEALARVLDSDELCRRLIERGYQRARQFEWAETGRGLSSLYSDLASA